LAKVFVQGKKGAHGGTPYSLLELDKNAFVLVHALADAEGGVLKRHALT